MLRYPFSFQISTKGFARGYDCIVTREQDGQWHYVGTRHFPFRFELIDWVEDFMFDYHLRHKHIKDKNI